ncbi:MAG: hypothetical protein PHV39_03315, partial [Methanomicrobium sp.]|nr:hypothetical protein [Methanomicrobium sp.]
MKCHFKNRFIITGIFIFFLLLIPSAVCAEDATLLWKFTKTTNFADTKISPDEGYVLAGGTNAMIYLLDNNGNLIWEKSVDGPVSGLSVSEFGEYSVVG